jgi:hypothetical protein
MAMKKSTPPRPAGNPGGRTSARISPSVRVLGPKLPGFTQLKNPPRKSLTPAQLKEAESLAAKLKAREVKAANEKKANSKIVKKQNKKPLLTGRGSTKPVTALSIGAKKKPVVKVKPPKGRPGLRGGMGGGGGLFGGRGLGGTR